MMSQKDAAAIAAAIAPVIEHRRRMIPADGRAAGAHSQLRQFQAAWDVCTAVGLEIEAATRDRVSVDRFLQWCDTGPAKLAEIERQLGGAA